MFLLETMGFLSLPFLSHGFCLLLLPALVSELTCFDSAAVLLIQSSLSSGSVAVLLSAPPPCSVMQVSSICVKKIAGKRIMTGLLGFALCDGQS